MAIEKFSNQSPKLYFAGRTDAGVHATNQIAHFDLIDNNKNIATAESLFLQPKRVLLAINHYLKNETIKIIACDIVDENFHARFGAKSRQYLYRILNRSAPPTIDAKRLWHIPQKIDLDLMKQVAEIIINETNLTAFLPQTELKEQDIATKFYHLRKIDSIDIKESREIIEITIESRSFFRHLVRSVVGAMIWVAIEKISIADFRSRIGNYRIDNNGNKAILNGRSNQDISPIAPPYGLFFTDVKY